VNASPLMRREFLESMFAPRFSRYATGGKYDVHADSAFMGPVRTDLAMTLFLTDDYEGGELCIDGIGLNGAPVKVKCSAGYAVVYECWRPHWVEPVTKGERIVAVTWLQSRIQNAEDREILQRLCEVIEDVGTGKMGAQERFAKLGAVHDKLVKRFAAH
jgi:PKHD-type hydroxylase